MPPALHFSFHSDTFVFRRNIDGVPSQLIVVVQ